MSQDSEHTPLLPEETPIQNYLRGLRMAKGIGHLVADHRLLPAREPQYAEPARPWPAPIRHIIEAQGVERLYTHQIEAIDRLRAGQHVVVATPTASGKTMVYNLPLLERCLHDPETRALYLFPLKALAQDQLRNFEQLTASWHNAEPPRAAIYDGDTSQWFRKKIRENPPNALLTNPEMLHLSITAHHARWTTFLAQLSFIVVDEVHTYRGILGSHMAQVFRRLLRICHRLGARPTFCFASATVGNPAELAKQLTGIEAHSVTESGAPQGPRHFVFLNPHDAANQKVGPAQASLLLLQSALHRELRTIVYTQSRRMTELLAMWTGERMPRLAGRISAYRAGFLPEERREIEAKMTSGELLAVISTSALELGIDIGALDLCILVGYPGTVMATLQRGGRVGRALRESAVILVAGEDALDQYFMRHPQDFFDRPAEDAVTNPDNPVLLEKHLECAAAELPLADSEEWIREPEAAAAVRRLELAGILLRSKDGRTLHASSKQPHRRLNLRGTGATMRIQVEGTEEIVGDIDETRACKETHPGAVYLHRGRSFVVQDLDLNGRVVTVAQRKVDFFTRVRGNKETEILEVWDSKPVWGAGLHLGRLRVTEWITGYEQRAVRGQRLLSIAPLDLPPIVFETVGLWIEIPQAIADLTYEKSLDFRGGIHALEHAAIGILPLAVMCDRNDLGGMSMPMHPQVRNPVVFIYDAAPGGVGLAQLAFKKAEEVLTLTRKTIADCPCEAGCPSCVHSPKCGSGNRPIDKAAALCLLDALREAKEECLRRPEGMIPSGHPIGAAMLGPHADVRPEHGRPVGGSRGDHSPWPPEASSLEEPQAQQQDRKTTSDGELVPPVFGVLDIETRRSAQEVGGWHKAHLMGVSIAVLYDSRDQSFHNYEEHELPDLCKRLHELPLIIGFNIKRFDYAVLGPHCSQDPHRLPTLDILEDVKARLGFRLKLDHLATHTLDAPKSADGLQALEWWKQGRLDLITEYCQHDVAITRDLFLYGFEHGYLVYLSRKTHLVRIPVTWREGLGTTLSFGV